MKEPQTIKGYIALIKSIEEMTLEDKKGFEGLSESKKNILRELKGQISNELSEYYRAD